MTERVDFYVLRSADSAQCRALACRLAEKAYLRDLRVVLVSESVADAKAIDDLMWTFNDRSFVPHRLYEGRASLDPETPVHLVADLAGIDRADVLVNLCARLPTGLERFARVAEILDADAERRRTGRERFKAYRDLKLPIDTHHLDEAAPP